MHVESETINQLGQRHTQQSDAKGDEMLSRPYLWTSVGPPEELGMDAIELAAISSSLLRHYADSGPSQCTVSCIAGATGGAVREFLVVELGAGFVRWSLETISLAKRLGIKV